MESALKEAKVCKKDDFGNIYSLISGKPTNETIAKAFQDALVKLPENVASLNVSLPDTKRSAGSLAREIAEQIALRGYNTRYHRQDSSHPNQLSTVKITGLAKTAAVQRALQEGLSIGKGINQARFLVDAPSNVKNPLWFCEQAVKLESAYPTLKVKISSRGSSALEGMNLFKAVATASMDSKTEQPRLLEMVYTPPSGKYDKTILLVGKGITFDTGGYNLKTDGNIKNMHGDMAGAAAVVGALKTIAEMKIPGVRVVGLSALTPNLIGSNATRPHSIVTSQSGKTVEIDNTDAEGRLTLADALHYGGEKYKPDLIVDIATLTGGKARGLGGVNAVALMGNNDKLVGKIETMEKALGRKTAVLKLTDAHRNWVTAGGKGKADVYNSVAMADAKRYNLFGPGVDFNKENLSHVLEHSAQGGAFLKEFLADPKTPWVHMDIAGAEFEPLAHQGGKEFATGFGVKDLYTLVKLASKGKL